MNKMRYQTGWSIKVFGLIFGLLVLLGYGFLKTGNIFGTNILISYISKNYVEFTAIWIAGLTLGLGIGKLDSMAQTSLFSRLIIFLLISVFILVGYSFYFKGNIKYIINLVQADLLRFTFIYISGLIVGIFLRRGAY